MGKERVLFFNQEAAIEAYVEQLTPHTIQILTDTGPNTSGFRLVTEDDAIYGEYPGYTTVYREIDGGFILSDDESIYTEPEPYVPTLEQVREMKVLEMNAKQQEVISAGIDVELTDKTVEHFTLTEHDQTSLMGLQTQVLAGSESIPWHTSDQELGCKYYTNADMSLITTKAMEFITYHVTYFRDLRIYIRSLQDRGAIEAITYGTQIPEQYQSQVLKDMLASMS